jgi:hypothetical protein
MLDCSSVSVGRLPSDLPLCLVQAFLNILLPKLKNVGLASDSLVICHQPWVMLCPHVQEFVAGQEIVLMEDEPPTDLYFIGSGSALL